MSIISLLKQAGLTEYESKIYHTLLLKGSLSGSKVSKFADVPHGRTYEVLLQLAQKGFISVIPTKPKVFSAVDPKKAIDQYMNKKIDDMSTLSESLSDQLSKIKSPSQKNTTREKVKVTWGTKNIRPMLDHKYLLAKKYIKMMFTYEYVSSSSISRSQKCLDKGIKIYRLATKLTDSGIEFMKSDIARGIEVRYFPVDELRIEITDGKFCQLHVVNPKDFMDRTFIDIESLELTKALEHYFDVIWKKAKPIVV